MNPNLKPVKFPRKLTDEQLQDARDHHRARMPEMPDGYSIDSGEVDGQTVFLPRYRNSYFIVRDAQGSTGIRFFFDYASAERFCIEDDAGKHS